MNAIVVADQAAGTAGMKLVERPAPRAARLGSLAGASDVLELDDGRELHGDRLLMAAGRRPRVNGIGVETLRMAVAS